MEDRSRDLDRYFKTLESGSEGRLPPGFGVGSPSPLTPQYIEEESTEMMSTTSPEDAAEDYILNSVYRGRYLRGSYSLVPAVRAFLLSRFSYLSKEDANIIAEQSYNRFSRYYGPSLLQRS